MSSDQKSLLIKYLVSTLSTGVVFSLASLVLPSKNDTLPTLRYIIPIIIAGVLIFFFYFNRFSGFKRKPSWRKGGVFYPILLFAMGIIFTPGMGIKIMEEYTHRVDEIESVDQISELAPEYFYIKNLVPELNELVYKWKNYQRKSSLKIIASTYVPLKNKNSLDSVYAYWVEFQKEGYYPYSMDEGGKESWAKKFVQQHNSWIDSLDFKTINHFTWRTDSYQSLPTKENVPNAKTIFLLNPYFESLQAEVKEDLLNFVILYTVLFGLYLFFVTGIYKPKGSEIQ